VTHTAADAARRWCVGVRTVFAPIAITPELLKRFWDKTELLPNGCIRWTGTVDPGKGGYFRVNGRQTSAHAMAWRLANGGKGVPVGMNVYRTCGNLLCVNIDHIELLSDSVLAERGNRKRGRIIKSDLVKPKPLMLADAPAAKKVTYVWKCLGCGAENRRDSLRVTASAAACNCGVYCQTRNMHKEIER
jgi:hypothetical protein